MELTTVRSLSTQVEDLICNRPEEHRYVLTLAVALFKPGVAIHDQSFRAQKKKRVRTLVQTLTNYENRLNRHLSASILRNT